MRWMKNLLFRLRALLGRGEMERGLEDEMAFHIEMETRKLEAAGHTPAEARRLARVKFGGVDRFKEGTRDSWGVTALHDLGADVRFAWRQLRGNPAFSLLAALTLALGIGGTVAIFSVVDGLVLRPLPVQDEGNVDVFWMDYDWRGVEFDFTRERLHAFSGLAAYSTDAVTLRTNEGSSMLMATISSAEIFDVLGAHALLGRTFQAGEDRPGAEPVIVLSYSTWQQDFGGDRDIVGRRIDIDGRMTTVIGVMPRDFYFPTPEMKAWTPLNLDPDDQGYQGNGWLVLVGRRAPGATDATVQADLNALAGALGERFDYPDAWDKTKSPHVTPVREYLLGSVRPAVLLLLGAVALVLLMACANVAALILTRTTDRTGEIAVRTALGAGRARLARQVLTESVLLGLVSGVAGMGLAVALFDTLVAALPLGDGLADTLSLDWPALVAALVLAAGTGALISLAPMRSLLAGNLAGAALGERRQGGGTAGPGRLQGALVVAEVMLAVVLVTGAGLLVRSVDRLRAIDPGLDATGVLTVGILMGEQALDVPRRAQFLRDIVEQTRAMPGVRAAGLINRVPIKDGGWQGTVSVSDRPDLTGDKAPNAYYRTVTPETFAALGAVMARGRGILPSDDENGREVAVVNEAFAHRMWGDEDPIGRIISRNGFTADGVEVVGVVRNIAVDKLVGEVPMAAYYPWAQTMGDSPFGILVVRSDLDLDALASSIRTLAHRLEPTAAIARVQTMSSVLDDAMSETLRLRFFLTLFGVMGLVMGTVGVYGVVSYSVRRRSAEFGIRVALGARPSRLLGQVVGRGMLPVGIGIMAGLTVALALARVVSGFLYEIAPSDPATLAAAAVVLGATGVLAALLPAYRASVTQPAEALRVD